MAKVIEGLYYSESHEYVKVEGEYGYVGITDYAQHQLGNVVYVDMPEVDDDVTAGECNHSKTPCRRTDTDRRTYIGRCG